MSYKMNIKNWRLPMEIKPELECHKYSDTYCYELVDKGNAPSGICIKNPNCEYRKNKYKEVRTANENPTET
jgi:hypothetical protein